MKLHKVRNPFYCRLGQFESGKRQLCIGIEFNALQSHEIFKCIIGNNKSIVYSINRWEGSKKGQIWRSPRGKEVVIIPLDYFTREGDSVVVEQSIKEVDNDPKPIQTTLF